MSFRIEDKLFIFEENLSQFNQYLNDKSAKKIFEPRTIQSLYFDNLKQDMYHDYIEGLTTRKKIRVRNYPDEKNDTILIETKISSVEGRFKTNKKIHKKYFDNIKQRGILDNKYGVCKPILSVNYTRDYYKKDDVRITLDSNISYKLYKNNAVKKDFEIVAELKTSIKKNLDDLFEVFPYQEIRFSKYCNGIQLFNKN